MSLLGYRWTLDEYVLRAELGTDTFREILVEGSTDRSFFKSVFDRYRLDDVVVRDHGYLEIADDEIQAAGFMTGAKGGLLTLASRVAASPMYASNDAIVVVVVDRDFDELPDAGLAAIALVTDYYSVENYALTERSMDRFVRQVLAREPRPPGAGGVVPASRNACSGAELMERIIPACIDIAAVRLVLRTDDPPLRAIERWSDYFSVSPDGAYVGRGADLAKATLERSARPSEGVADRLVLAVGEAAQAPRKYVRGRDFVRLLHKLLRSAWGRRVSSINFARVEEPTLTTWVLGAIDPGELDGEALFVSLREILAPA